LADIIRIIGGGTPKTNVPEYWDGDIPWLSVNDFNNNQRHVFNAEKKISKEGLDNSSTKILKTGQLIISARGTVGALAQLARDMAFNQSCYGINGKPELVTNDFLYYLLKQIVSRLQMITHGAVFDTITRETFKHVEVEIPTLPEQRAIANILGKLDDKIELNRQMNETLGAIARAIFKSWFVNFDPVRAKAEGRDPGLPPAIADLFPDSFEDSPLGPIPKGWKVQSLFDIISIIGGGTPDTKVPEYWNGDIPWFSVVDAPRESDVFVIDTENYITQLGVDKSSTKILREGTTIISARGTVGKCALVGYPMAMNQSCYGIQGKKNQGDFFIYFTIRHQVADLQRSGHGSVFNTITKDTFRSIRIVNPIIELTHAFDKVVRFFLKKILNNLEESANLFTIRDTLLPKLLTGELRIQEANKFAVD